MSSAIARIQVGGAVVPNQHVYITRPEDDVLFNLLLEGQFCNILTSRQMGKSSLMQQTALRLRSRGVAVATMDIAGEIGNEPNQELAWQTIIDKVGQDLNIDCDIEDWWREQRDGTSNRKLLRFFRDVVCAQIAAPVVVFFDEIDSTLRLPYADDLFTALRTIYNERATEEAYQRLTFCLVGVATPNELVRDRRTTAYNIGTTIPLRDFDEQRDDLAPLLATLDLDDYEDAVLLLRRILYWTGGHPFLTAKFCKVMAGKTAEEVDALVESRYADLSELRTDDHFSQIVRFFDERLKGDPALEPIAILERIVRGKTVLDKSTEAHAQLKLSGIVKPNSKSELVIRNRIYGRLFDREWLRSLKPKKRLLWLRRTAVAAVVGLAIALTAIYVYLRIYLPNQIAETHWKRLYAATSLSEAKNARDILAGKLADPVTKILLKGREAEANVAYRRVRDRWVREKTARANELIAKGYVEDGLILAADTADKSGEKLDPRYENIYAARGYEYLVATLHSSFEFWPGLAVSADGHNVAIGNAWWVEQADGWAEVQIDTTASINTVAFGPDGALYTGDDDGAITRWELDAAAGKITRKPVTVVEGGPRVLDLAIEPDGRPVIIAEGEDARALKISEQSVVLKTSQSPAAVALTEDGKSIVTTAGQVLTIWNLAGGSIEYLRKTAFRDVAVGADRTIAVAESKAVALLKAKSSPAEIASIPHAPPVRSVALSGNLLATASDEGARVFDLKTLRDLDLPLGEGRERRGSNVQAVAFDARQNRLIVRRRDSVQIWSLGGKIELGGTRLQQWERKFGKEVPSPVSGVE